MRERATPLALSVVLPIVWLVSGTNYLAFKIALETIPTLTMVGSRNVVAGLLILPLVVREGLPSSKHFCSLAIAAVLLVVLGQGGIIWGVRYLPVGAASLLGASSPIWVTIFGRLLFGAKASRIELIGVCCGMLGLALLVTPDEYSALDLRGVIGVMGGAMCWALGSLYVQRADLPQNPLVCICWQMLIAGGIISSAAIWSDMAILDVGAISRRSIAAFFFLVFAGSLVGFGGITWLMRRSTAAIANTFNYIAPMIAIMLGVLIFGEVLTTRMIVAACLSLLGVAFILRGNEKQPAAA